MVKTRFLFFGVKQKIGENPMSNWVESCDRWCIYLHNYLVEADCQDVTFIVEAKIHVFCTGILH